MSFDSGGRVGIGTTTPPHTLTVVGDLNVTGSSYLGNLVLSSDSISTNNITSKSRNISFYNDTGSEIMKIDGGNARVGIGTTIPSYNLHVNDTIAVGSAVGTFGGDDNLIRPGSSSAWLNLKGGVGRAKIAIGNDAMHFMAGGAASGGVIVFRTGASSSTNTGTERMRIDNSSNVGIGTTGPTAKLEINATIGTAAFNIHNDTGSSKFFVNATSSRVGIGTTTPPHTLTVVGDLNVTGFSITDDSLVTVVEFYDENGNVINPELIDNYYNNKKSINNELINYEDNYYNNNNKGYRIEPNKLTPDNNNNNNYYNNENKNGLYYDNNINKPINAIYNNKENCSDDYYDELINVNNINNQEILDSRVYKARSLTDKATLRLRGRCGFETDNADVPSRLHLSSNQNIQGELDTNKLEINNKKKKDKQARSLDKTLRLRGFPHFNNYKDNNYLNVSINYNELINSEENKGVEKVTPEVRDFLTDYDNYNNNKYINISVDEALHDKQLLHEKS